MLLRWLCLAVVALICLESATGVPLIQTKKNEKSLSNFLRQDKEFLMALERDGLGGAGVISRVRRQVEQGDLDPTDQSGQQQPGFFDRAAKFVMELMQRFLKWINTDDN